MKRALLMLLSACLLGGLAGCAHRNCQNQGLPTDPSACYGPDQGQFCADGACESCHGVGCHRCGPRYPGAHLRGRVAEMPAQGGPPSGQITYPYYTLRGPRDFLAPNPPSIGP